jgi:hypothetical protein
MKLSNSGRKTPEPLNIFSKTKHKDLSSKLTEIFQNELKILLSRMLKVQVVITAKNLVNNSQS